MLGDFCLFVFAQQLHDSWLLAEEHDADNIIDMVVLEQFIP